MPTVRYDHQHHLTHKTHRATARRCARFLLLCVTGLIALGATGSGNATAPTTPASLPIGPAEPRRTADAPVDFVTLAQRVTVVIVGTVAEAIAQWNAEHTLIHTYATYDVHELLQGPPGLQQVVVKYLGGEVGAIGQTVVGGPQAAIGDQHLLFLVPSGEPGMLEVLEFVSGQFVIARHGAAGAPFVVVPPVTPETLLLPRRAASPSVTGTLAGTHATHGTHVPLDVVLQELREAE